MGSQIVKVSRWNYPNEVIEFRVKDSRHHQRELIDASKHKFYYRSLSGVLEYFVNDILPRTALMASKMQQNTGLIKVNHLQEANCYVRDVINLRPFIRFIPPTGIFEMLLTIISDASDGDP